MARVLHHYDHIPWDDLWDFPFFFLNLKIPCKQFTVADKLVTIVAATETKYVSKQLKFQITYRVYSFFNKTFSHTITSVIDSELQQIIECIFQDKRMHSAPG